MISQPYSPVTVAESERDSGDGAPRAPRSREVARRGATRVTTESGLALAPAELVGRSERELAISCFFEVKRGS
jgi:hypothetical protein